MERYIHKVKVVNKSRETYVDVRHIIYVEEVTTLEEIKDWYYEHFEKLDGDEFIIVNKDGSEEHE